MVNVALASMGELLMFALLNRRYGLVFRSTRVRSNSCCGDEGLRTKMGQQTVDPLPLQSTTMRHVPLLRMTKLLARRIVASRMQKLGSELFDGGGVVETEQSREAAGCRHPEKAMKTMSKLCCAMCAERNNGMREN